MFKKKNIFFILSAVLLLTSLIGGVILVQQRQETRRGATHNCYCMLSGSCVPRTFQTQTCSEGCSALGGSVCTPTSPPTEPPSNGITEACGCGGWHEGWCDANACNDDPDNCCGGECMSGLVKCTTLGRCQRADENCPGGTECDPSVDCEVGCSGTPPTAYANCNEDCAAQTRAMDVCRGKQTGANCQKCSGCSTNGENCDIPCHCCEGKPLDDACWGKCYEKGPGYNPQEGDYSNAPYFQGSYDCRNTQSDVLVEGQHIWNCRWEDGRTWWECSETPTNTPTPTATPTSTPTSTPTPTVTPVYSCDCLELRMYDLDWNLITDYSLLLPESEVYLAVTGETDHPAGIVRARFRINGGEWQETTDQNNNDEFYIDFQIPDYGDYTVEAQIFTPDLGWH